MINKAYLLLGGDKGDRIENINNAIQRISIISEEAPLVSPVFESDPWGFDSDSKFLNVAVVITTKLNAFELLSKLLEIESELGRVRETTGAGTGEYSSREIDIDIIFFNNEIIDKKELIVPHPRMHLRRFVLQPLSHIAPQFIHPVFKKSVLKLLDECEDKLPVLHLE